MSSPIQGGEVVLETEEARNIDLWKDAEVYFSDAENPTIGADGTLDENVWAHVGLLNVGSAIGREPEIERNDIESFGSKKQMTDVRSRKDVRSFTPMTNNGVVHEIMWPGSTEYTDDGVMVLAAPKTVTKGFFAFKTVNSFGDILIDVTRRKADAYGQGESKSDDGAETRDITVDVMEDEYGQWYDRLRIKADGTTVNEPAAPIRIDGVTEAGPLA